ncbi:hypothetical protein N7456_011332 [Penicillium angulare]|uniref:Fe2OG dioxygenase domain-containing protein n=1 Tax=Penicillium angulare TaxID=116970 RepID=A0A9W9ETS5_9EURO|nr:hypothetical protein N7456_011332 [Penicillium angulare]
MVRHRLTEYFKFYLNTMLDDLSTTPFTGLEITPIFSQFSIHRTLRVFPQSHKPITKIYRDHASRFNYSPILPSADLTFTISRISWLINPYRATCMAGKRLRGLDSSADQSDRQLKRILRPEDEGTEEIKSIPPFHGEPSVWATSRTSLCESLPYYRSVQGSLYHKDGVTYGCLIDGDSGIRFHIDEEVVITRVGGSYAKPTTTGQLELTTDQSRGQGAMKFLENALRDKSPIAFIVGDKNSGLHRKPPHRYNVMDFFQVTDLWSEKIDGHVGMRVRYEKINLSEKSWWARKGSADPVPHEERDLSLCPEHVVCETCKDKSPRLFNEGWMCLVASCPQFWRMDGAEAPQDLTYAETFLNKREVPRIGIRYPFPLKPNLVGDLLQNSSLRLTCRDNWRGIVCPLCGKCIPRMFWNGWKCTWKANMQSDPTACKWVCLMNLATVPLHSLTSNDCQGAASLDQFRPSEYESTGFYQKTTDYISSHPYVRVTYTISDIGVVSHFISNQGINEQLRGPDAIFHSLQNSNLGLRRYPHNTPVGETATAHFAQNYKVVGEDAIETSQPNELLLIGYFEGMKMGYHDDGEKGLGPTIASLSLGGSSKMTLRMKAKYFHGQTSSNCITKGDPVLKGCRLEEERRALREELDLGIKDQQAYEEALKALFRQNPKKTTGMAPVAVTMNLHHGDMVVMNGALLQRYYEHSVVPDKNSILRYALTARSISPGSAMTEADLERSGFQLTGDQVYDGH